MPAVKNIFFSVLTNIWVLLVSVFLNFVTPLYISVEDYGSLRSFMLYISFSGLLHFGFIDGIYLMYGGKDVNEVSDLEIRYHKRFVLLYQSIICLIFLIIGYFTNNMLICYFAVASLLINYFNLGNFFFQAVNQFGVFGRANFFANLYTLVCIATLFLVFNNHNYHSIIYVIISSYAVGALIYEFFYAKKLKGIANEKPDKKSIIKVFNYGGLILVGNILLLYFMVADRWVINIFFGKEVFAYYSFAGAILTIIISLITSVSTAIYPILVKNYSKNNIDQLKTFTLLMAVAGQALYFIAHIVIDSFLPKYANSLEILKYMFLGLPALSIIIVISTNYYKINKLGKHYVMDLGIMGMVACMVNAIIYIIKPDPVFIVLGTFVTFNIALWFVNRRNKNFHFTVKDILYYGLGSVSYITLASLSNSLYLLTLIYLFVILFLSLAFYKGHLIAFTRILVNSMKFFK